MAIIKDEVTGFITRTNEPAPIQINERERLEGFLLKRDGVISPEYQAHLDETYPLTEVRVSASPKFGEIDMGHYGSAESGRIYTEAELQNHTFFMAHKADILLAQREGRVNANVYEPRG